jgi:hypothetical protein
MLLATMCLGGCAATPPRATAEPSATSATVTYRISGTPARFQHATVEGGRIFGPAIEVTNFGDSYRGQVHGATVDLRWNGDRLVGRVGIGVPTSLQFRELTDGFDMIGTLGGGHSVIAVRSNRLIGVMGSCRFDLITDDGLSYREIAGRPMEVVMSPGVADLPPRERAVVLAMLFSN